MKLRQKAIAAAELPVNEESTESAESQPPNPNDYLEDLKTALVTKCSRNELIRKLNNTRELRKVLLTTAETDLRHRFPFFFADPELVSNIFVCTINTFYVN